MNPKNKNSKKWMLAASAVILASSYGSTQAAVIYEPFAPDGGTTLSGNPGGTGLTGNWTLRTGTNHQEDANLTYGTLPTSGGSVTTTGGWNTSSVSIDTNTPGYSTLLANGGEMWFSMLYNPGTADDQRFGFSIGNDVLGGGNGINNSQGIGFGWTPQELFYSKLWHDTDLGWTNNLQNAPGPNGNVTANQSTNALNTVYFIVGHVQWGATSTDNDTVTLYLPDTNLALGNPMATDFNVIADQSGFDTISTQILRAGAFYDEIRIGATAAAVGVIPEPSAALLGGLSVLALLRRRR